jgi:hypothetical protein
MRAERSHARYIVNLDLLWGVVGLLLLCIFLAQFIPPKQSTATTEGVKPPGAIMIETTWPDDNPADIDLWVQAPGDVPVGYSNKGGAVFNLLRDDLGSQFDLTNMNYESSFARGLVPGEYTVNLHSYRGIKMPVLCKVVVSVQTATDTVMRQILATEVTLTREGQERTALRFRLDAKGALVSGSANSIQRPLRSGKKS